MNKTRASKSWSKHNLPEELWPEILSRLPVKVVFRFRCVSKSWKLLIDDPNFSRLHLYNFNKHHEPNLFFALGRSPPECVVKNLKTFKTIFSLGFLQSDLDSLNVLRTTPTRSEAVRCWSIVCSVDGLFMLQSSQRSDFMLWNPSIRKTLTLPPSPAHPLNNMYNFGLGFDPLSMDYKFVRFAVNRNASLTFVAVYTLATNSWKAAEYQGQHQEFFLEVGKRSISCSGVVYALTNLFGVVVSFNLRTELFASIELPETDEEAHHQGLTLIGLVSTSMSNVAIWQLEGDHVKSWRCIQRCVFPGPDPFGVPSYMLFLWLKKNGAMLLKCDETEMVMCYNLETHQHKMMLAKNKKYFAVRDTVEYKESLILHH